MRTILGIEAYIGVGVRDSTAQEGLEVDSGMVKWTFRSAPHHSGKALLLLNAVFSPLRDVQNSPTRQSFFQLRLTPH